jgi:hypothetical protein
MGGKSGHVEADLGDDDGGRGRPDSGDLIEPGDRVSERAGWGRPTAFGDLLTPASRAVVTGGASGIGVDLFASNAGIAIDGGIDTPAPPSRRRGGLRSLRLRTRSAQTPSR